jgi:predicted nuclease of predicted toxin-antitoxin system
MQVVAVQSIYSDSQHVKTLGLINTDDALIWEFAKFNNLVIVSKDSDFHQRSLLYGHPPKFIYLRIGNSPTAKIIEILRGYFWFFVTWYGSIGGHKSTKSLSGKRLN